MLPVYSKGSFELRIRSGWGGGRRFYVEMNFIFTVLSPLLRDLCNLSQLCYPLLNRDTGIMNTVQMNQVVVWLMCDSDGFTVMALKKSLLCKCPPQFHPSHPTVSLTLR